MIRLSAFADEISPELNAQIDIVLAEGIRNFELRSVWDVGILDLTEGQVAATRAALQAARIGVTAIASPVGKVPADIPLEQELGRLDRAIVLSNAFDCSHIRIFSFYPPASEPELEPDRWRPEVSTRLDAMVERAAQAGVTLLHENDVGLYGATIDRCVELLELAPSPHLAAVLDPANFIQSGQIPYPDGYEAIKGRLESVHVKDARDGIVCAAGEGEARFPELLQKLCSSGYDGVFALEPHLKSAGRLRGFSGPDRFRFAAGRFKSLLEEAGTEWQ